MTERHEQQGVEETARAWETPPAPEPLRARPVAGPIDAAALVEDMRRRFPKILARLAE